jgi:hypothetical protein
MMSRILAAFSLASLIALSGCETAPPEEVSSPPPVEAIPAEWTHFSEPEGAYRFGLEGRGRWGARIPYVEGAGRFGGLVATKVDLATGGRYAARGLLRLQDRDAAEATIKLDYFDDRSMWLRSIEPGRLTTGGDSWRLVAVSEPPDRPARARYLAAVLTLQGNGKVWFDDLELIERDDEATVGNLLSNGSMENIAGRCPTGWSIDSKSDGRISCEWSDERPFDGRFSLCLDGDAAWSGVSSRPVAVERGKAYRLEASSRVERGRARLRVDCLREGAWLSSRASEQVDGPRWQQLGLRIGPEELAGATEVTIALTVSGPARACFDGVVIRAD